MTRCTRIGRSLRLKCSVGEAEITLVHTGHVPDSYLCIYLLLSQRPGHRDAVVAVSDEVDVPDLDQFYQRQRYPPLPGGSDAQPALPVVRLEWLEACV